MIRRPGHPRGARRLRVRGTLPVRPDRGPRVVGEERPQELVAVVRPEWIGPDAHGVAHRVRTLRTFLSAAPSAWLSAAAAAGLDLLAGNRRWARCGRRRLKERS